MQADEAELVARSLRHDTAAYAELVERYKNALYHHCYAIARDEDLAEDIAQETFITAYYKLSTFDTSRRLSTWLFKIATNKALRALKQRKNLVYNDDIIVELRSPQPEPIELAQHREVRHAVARLEPKYRTVISLYYWQGLGYAEIAQVMNKPEGSIKTWIRRAKLTLRKELS